jgi:hypothetical protein
MYYSIKKNQKKLMALFAVLLMISFVATFSVGRSGGGGGRADTIAAYVGSTPVYDSELRAVQADWNWARRTPVHSMFGNQLPVAVDVILYTLIPRPPDFRQNQEGFFRWYNRYMGRQQGTGEYARALHIANTAAEAMDQHNELLYLLSQEAQRDGLQINPDGDEVNAYLFNALSVQPSEVAPGSVARSAIARLLLVAAEIHRLKDSIKVSRPFWQHEAVQSQSVRLNLIDFRASDFEKSVPAPTTQQVQQEFERFKDVPPHQPSASNPLGFGYQIPARVKLQYIEIPHSEVVQAIIHTVPPAGADASIGSADAQYDWEVQAASYYNAHQDEFQGLPQTRPSTQAAVQTVTTEPTTSVATTKPQPTTKPFEEVKQQIIEKLAAPQAEKLSKQIADELAAGLTSDFQLIRQTDPTSVVPGTQPASQPAAAATTQPIAPLMMFSHLEQIRDQVQRKYHVAIELHDIGNDWQTQPDLAKLPGIGSAANNPDGVSFPELATSFQTPASLNKEPALQLWQPSPILADGQQNTYLFRLTAAEPPHPPSDMASIAKQVESDWKLSQAYDQAMQAAQKALASAKSVGISQAARTAGLQVVSTPLFQPGQAQEIPGYPLSNPAAQQVVAKAADDLLTQASPSDKQPDTLVPLPSVARVAVIELAAAQLPQPEWLMQYSVTQQQQMAELERLTEDWFDYNRVVARLGYKVEQKSP